MSDQPTDAANNALQRMDLPLSLLMVPGLHPTLVDLPARPRTLSASSGPAPATVRPADMPMKDTRAYDLSESAALEAGVPALGSGSGGGLRRVIVLEHVGYDERKLADGGIEHVGFAIRLCVTVSKLDSNVKLSLPFITASAQLGSTEAVWTLQIVGLTGPKISAVKVVPTELNVETFVIAKQSLERLIDAVTDPETLLSSKVIARQGPPTTVEARYSPAVLQVAALSAIARGWNMQTAGSRFGYAASNVPAMFAAVYQDVAGLTSITAEPAREKRAVAVRILDGLIVKPA